MVDNLEAPSVMTPLHTRLLLAALVLMGGCAAKQEFVPPTKANLQDPVPGTALIYLLRSPYDDEDLSVFVDSVKAAFLPAGRYTALSLAPGHHTVVTVFSNARHREQIPPFDFEANRDQRYFLNLPAPERKTEKGLIAVLPVPGAVVPVMGQRVIETGAPRSWVQLREDESHWFIFYAKPIAPEPNAL
jgi:hypothetical protein